MTFGLGIVSGSGAGRVLPLPARAHIGRDPHSAEVCLEEPGVAPRHAQLLIHGEIGQLVALSDATWVDGEPVPPAHPVTLRAGSLLRFGETLVLFDEAQALRQSSELVLSREDGPGGSWILACPLEIGRGSNCGVQLDPEHDALASSQHAHLLPAFGRAVLTDLGSANGTYKDHARVLQVALAPGERFHLGGVDGPTFRLDASTPTPAPTSRVTSTFSASGIGPAPIPDVFRLQLRCAEQKARIDVACKPEVRFGSFAGLNDFETSCFARELESEADALDRSEAIGPQHGTLVLTEDGVELCDAGDAPTKLDGTRLPPQGRARLDDAFELWLGADSLGLRGRLFRHPNLPPTTPAVGSEAQHPVECVTLERMGDGDQSRLYLHLVRQASIGASEDAAIHLPAPGVGDLHALLYLQQDALWITQVGADPVAVNGVPLSAGTTVPIPVGSEFFVGTVMFRVEEID